MFLGPLYLGPSSPQFKKRAQLSKVIVKPAGNMARLKCPSEGMLT